MRRPTVAMAALAAVALGPSEALAMLDCQKIKADGYMFNLGELKGPHSVVTSWYDSGSDTYHNTTYTVDICNPLKKSDKGKECPKGTRGTLFCEQISARESTSKLTLHLHLQCAASAG